MAAFRCFAGVGERTREGNDLWLEMQESGVVVAGNSEKSRLRADFRPDDRTARRASTSGIDRFDCR